MSARLFAAVLIALLALTARAQEPVPLSPLTETLLLTQRPVSVPLEQWKEMIRKPTTAALYPIRLTQAMLDTLDVKHLDIRYQYVMMASGTAVPQTR